MNQHHQHNAEHVEGESLFDGRDLDAGLAVVDSTTFTQQPVHFVDVDGDAIAEGDIILGRTADLDAAARRPRADSANEDDVQHGVAIEQERYRWTDGVVPYTVKPGFSTRDRQEITDAIAHWHARTNIRLVPRTSQANYVEFEPSNQCSSYVGMIGGRQPIKLAPGCSLGSVIHEIGHAVGLWHEQSREDRDDHITVHYQNIQPAAVGNFNRQVANGVDVGRYDYGSIMHYPRFAFSRNGRPTITPKRAGVTIGQRSGLSAGDIATVRWMYPNLEPTRTWRGVQFRGTVPANSTRVWFTHSWPSYWYVDWSVMPLTPIEDAGPHLSVEVRVTRQAERLAKYFLVVTNHSSRTATFEARYAVLGWSRAARDEVSDSEQSEPVDAASDGGAAPAPPSDSAVHTSGADAAGADGTDAVPTELVTTGGDAIDAGMAAMSVPNGA